HIAFPALVTIPQVCRGIVVDHARYIDGKGIERLNRMPGRPVLASSSGGWLTRTLAWQFPLRLTFLARCAAKQIREPSATGRNWRWRERRLLGAARREATGLGPRQRTLLHLIARWRRGFVSRRGLAARCRFVAAADDGKRRLLARPTDRLDRIEV